MLHKEEIVHFLKTIRQEIIQAFEKLEGGALFIKTPWERSLGGGGEIGLLRGNIFEKAAVNFSAVEGENFPMSEASGPYFATGISVITHMHNPQAPTAHMNIRYIETEEKSWLGGGFDLTPMGESFAEDTLDFHAATKTALDLIDPTFYPLFSKQAETYFFIPHRHKERGVGGIFFDHLETSKTEHWDLWKRIGPLFLEALMPIYARRVFLPFNEESKKLQLSLRGHYVEFNLIYDKGTRFGFLSGGNPEAILCSLPPLVTW